MYPPGYAASASKDPVPLDLLFTDSLSADRSLACREAGYPYIQGDRYLVGDVLPYRETRIISSDKPKIGEDKVDVLKIFKDENKQSIVQTCKVEDLVSLVAGDPSSGEKTLPRAGKDSGSLHATIVFIQEGQLSAECIRRLTQSFHLTTQFWDYYGTACIISSVSKMVTDVCKMPTTPTTTTTQTTPTTKTDDITLHLCQPIATVPKKEERKSHKSRNFKDSEINFDFNTPSFFLKWQRNRVPERPGETESPSQAPEVLLLCLLSPKTAYTELKDAIIAAYSNTAARAILQHDAFGLIGVVMLQWLGWSQELFYYLEQLVLGIESDLDQHLASPGRTSKKLASRIDFSEMHRVSKHIIQCLDTLEITTQLQDSVIQNHEKLRKARRLSKTNEAFQRIDDSLSYYRLAFIGVKSRVQGLKSRMDNQINLGFNLTQQRDAQVGQETNKSMYSLSLITLAFLPLTAIASVLAMPYFSVHDADITWVGSEFTLKYAITTAVLLSILFFLLWCSYVYHETVLLWLWRAGRKVSTHALAKDGEDMV